LAYSPLVWKNDITTPLNKTNLNRIEQGINKLYNGTGLYFTSTNVGNAYSVTSATPYTSYTEGMCINVKFNVSNTGASTINVDGLGVKNIKKIIATGKVDIVANDILTNGIYQLIYDGVDVILHNYTSKMTVLESGTPTNGQYVFYNNDTPQWSFGNIGRLNSEWYFNDAVYTTCGLNSSGEITLDDYVVDNTVNSGASNDNTFNVNANTNGIGQRFDSTFTTNMTYIKGVSFYIYKQGNPGSLVVTIYDETAGSTLATTTIPASSIAGGNSTVAVSFFPYATIVSGNVIQVRVTAGTGTFDGSNYYSLFTSNTSTVANSFAISTTNSWSSKTDYTTRDFNFSNFIYISKPKQTSGNVVKTYTPQDLTQWANLKFTKTTPTNTSVTCDVLDNNNNVLKSNVTSIADLSDIDVTTYPTVKVKWTLTRNATSDTTPKVYAPSITFEAYKMPKMKNQIFTSNGYFTAPQTGVYKVTVTGGGGSGALSYSYRCGGGGAGGTAIKNVSLTKGTYVAVTIGLGGISPTASSSHGNTGGTSSFGAYCSATGGGGGYYTTSVGIAQGGTCGNGSGGDINIYGGIGMFGRYSSDPFDGMGGTSFYGGDGAYGTGSAGNSGSNGKLGVVIVEWVEDSL